MTEMLIEQQQSVENQALEANRLQAALDMCRDFAHNAVRYPRAVIAAGTAVMAGVAGGLAYAPSAEGASAGASATVAEKQFAGFDNSCTPDASPPPDPSALVTAPNGCIRQYEGAQSVSIFPLYGATSVSEADAHDLYICGPVTVDPAIASAQVEMIGVDAPKAGAITLNINQNTSQYGKAEVDYTICSTENSGVASAHETVEIVDVVPATVKKLHSKNHRNRKIAGKYAVTNNMPDFEYVRTNDNQIVTIPPMQTKVINAYKRKVNVIVNVNPDQYAPAGQAVVKFRRHRHHR